MTTPTELRALADKFSAGWHEGIKIDACDVMLLTDAASLIEVLEDSAAAKANSIDRLGELVERETAARREAQEQLYAARERHTAEVKKLQVEIGRLQALRREPMTEEQVQQLIFVGAVYAPDGKVTRTPQQYRDELRSAMTQGFRIAEAHHHITQKEQSE